MSAISGFHNASSTLSAPMFVLDRGPASHFFGRNSERAIFLDVRNDAVASCAGTTFLIKGAPGAGKTALLHKLADDATADGWQVFHIKRCGLTEPDDLARQLGVDYNVEISRHVTGSVKLVSAGRTRTSAEVPTSKEIRASAAKVKKGLLLVLDEAQEIADLKGHIAAETTLDLIHNGEIGHPVILLAGGLGRTIEAFASLGISRFAR